MVADARSWRVMAGGEGRLVWSCRRASACDDDFTDAGVDADQTRKHNTANEVAGTGNLIDESASGTGDWIDPAYDLRGNMTTGPAPGSETVAAKRQWYVYDAWNRLTAVWEDTDGDGTRELGTITCVYTVRQCVH